jgi:hypothetical protein
MRHRRFKTKPRPEALTIADLVASVERFGAQFQFTGAESLRVRGLEKLPSALREAFLNCDGAQLVAWLKSRKK